MSRNAKEIIEIEMREKTGILNLHDCGLQKWPEEIFEMTWLKVLMLGAYRIWKEEEFILRSVFDKYKNRLNCIPIQIKKLINLIALDLSGNQISRIENLDCLLYLKNLSLNNNLITRIENLEKLKRLEKLDLFENQIQKIESLNILQQLKNLELGRNKIVKIENLGKLKQLKILGLAQNHIQKIENLEELKQLQTLNLGINHIQKIENLEELEQLRRLDLFKTKISKIENLEESKRLKELNLSYNQIFKIENLNELQQLETLFLRNAGIEKIKNKAAFKKLVITVKELFISENPFTEETYLNKHRIIVGRNHKEIILKYLNDELSSNDKRSFKKLPIKIILLGNSEVGKTTLAKKLIADEKQFVGENDSAHGLKIRKWQYNEKQKAFIYDFGGQDYYHAVYQLFFTFQTQYVVLWENYKYEDGKICYKRKESRGGKSLGLSEQYYCFKPNYWLGHIAYFVQRAIIHKYKKKDDNIQLMSVQNIFSTAEKEPLYLPSKIDENVKISHQLQVNLKDESSLGEARFNLLKALLQMEIRKLQDKQKQYFNDEDRGLVDKIIAYIDSTQEKENEFDKEKFIETFGHWSETVLLVLHYRGLILYFAEVEKENTDDIALQSYVWINPAKVAEKIYQVLSRKSILQYKGKVPLDELDKLENISPAFKKLMLKKEVIFKNEEADKSEYIVPQYLEAVESEDPLYVMATLGMKQAFYLRFSDYVPHGLMSRLICRFGQNPNKKYFYRYELIFTLADTYKTKMAKVRVRLDLEELLITVQYVVLKKQKKYENEIANYLFTAILAAYWNETHLPFGFKRWDYVDKHGLVKDKKDWSAIWNKAELDEFIPHDLHISLDNIYYVHHRQELIIEKKEDKKSTDKTDLPITLVRAFGRKNKDLKHLEKYNFNAFRSENAPKIKKVFLAYSPEDTTQKNELERFLVNLEREKLIEIWHEGLVKAHENWNDKIAEHLAAADIVILLVSQSFIASTHVYENVMPKAIEKVVSNKGKIIPFVLNYCDLENWKVLPKAIFEGKNEDAAALDLGNYQPLPQKNSQLLPLKQWKENKAEAYMALAKEMRAICTNVF
ncbi:MAG: leucine-rich repeat domain-containing protein [Chitinophagales bacterium]